jgi:hypothetical protein
MPMDSSPCVLYPSRTKSLTFLVVSVLFVVGGIWLREDGPVAAWLTIVFFGLGAAVFGANLLPGSSYLKLTSEGFEQRVLFRTHSEAWKNIQRFEAYRNPTSSSRLVGLFYEPDYASTARGVAGRKISRSMVGVDGALPDTYGMSADELAELMNNWLESNKPLPR